LAVVDKPILQLTHFPGQLTYTIGAYERDGVVMIKENHITVVSHEYTDAFASFEKHLCLQKYVRHITADG